MAEQNFDPDSFMSQLPQGWQGGHIRWHHRRVVLVFDPRVSAEERRRIVRKANAPDERISEAFIGLWTGLSALFLICAFILHFLSGVGWWWVIGSLISTIVAGVAGGVVDSQKFQLDKHDLTLFIATSELNDSCKTLLSLAQRAIDTVFSSTVYAEGLLSVTVERTALKQQEWEIALRLRDISNLTAEMEDHEAGGIPGPQTAAKLQPRRHALKLARDGIRSRISALERFAAEVQKADAAKRDWEYALKISGLDDRYLDLVAGTAADKLAIEELTEMTGQAAAVAQVFRDSLHEASLAAESVVLPARPWD